MINPFIIQILRKSYPIVEFFGLYKGIAHNYFFKPKRFPFPESEKKCLKHALKEDLIFKNQTIKTYQWGNNKNSEKILLVHGWSGRATQFRTIIETLENNCHIISFDAPAHGLSTGSKCSMLDMTEIMSLLIEKHKIKKVIGHSLGGAACVYGKIHSNLTIQKIVLIAAPSNASNMLDDFVQKINGGIKTKKYIEQEVNRHFNKDLDYFFGQKIITPTNFCETLAIHDRDDTDVRYENVLIFKQLINHIKIYSTSSLGHTKILRDKTVIAEIKKFLF